MKLISSTAATLLGTFPKNACTQLARATFRYSYTPQNPKTSCVEQYASNVQQQVFSDLTAQVVPRGKRNSL